MKDFRKTENLRCLLPGLLPGLLLTAANSAAVIWLLRHIGWLIVTFGEDLGLRKTKVRQFSAIFGQLAKADITLPLLLTFLLCLALGLLVCRIACGRLICRLTPGKSVSEKPLPASPALSHKKIRLAAAVSLCLILFIPVLVLTLWFTKVNGLRFGIVLRQLYAVVQSGAL